MRNWIVPLAGIIVIIGLLAAWQINNGSSDTYTPGVTAMPAPLPTYTDLNGPTHLPHLLLVNVAGALPAEALAQATNTAARQLRRNIATAAIASFTPSAAIDNWPAWLATTNTVLTVFITTDPNGPGFLNCPGTWALVNIRNLRHDSPDTETYTSRVTKMALKGLAHAAGVGANQDSRCVMYYKSFSLAGIDATSASYSPFAYFPLSETLRDLGGDALALEE